MMTVNIDQRLTSNQPQPKKNWDFWITRVLLELSTCFHKSVLDYIRFIDSAFKQWINAKRHHAFQAFSVLREDLF